VNITRRPTLIIFQGGALAALSPLERLVAAAQQAATRDLLAEAARSNAFHQAILVTEDPSLTEAAQADAATWATPLPLHIEPSPTTTFHFGQSLHTICKSYALERVVYIGGGAMPLGSARDLGDMALAVGGQGQCVTANNLYSADMVAFWPASALDLITLPPTDNDLAWLLHFRGGLPFAPMPRTLAAGFDIDTPTDLATLWWASQSPPTKSVIGPALSETLAKVPTSMPQLALNIERAYKVMATRRAEVLVAGRVGSWVWRRLETNLPCQTRIISEERGMRAGGREERGEARSLLGMYNDAVGTTGLITALEQVCNAAFLDTRVLFAHRRLKPTPQDRFASDALLPELISDPYVRELTEAALSASIPLVLGGHSLGAGGLWALSERVRASATP
jgi:hypothetical protein